MRLRRLVTSVRHPGVSWQQGSDLFGVGGVVQHDQGAGAGQPVAVGRGPGRQVVWDLLTGNPEQAQESVEDRGRVGRWLGRVGMEPAQVDEQHPGVGRFADEQVPGVDGQLGLADPGHPGDRGDHHRPAILPPVVQRPSELVQFDGAAGERGQIMWQPVLNPDLRCGLDLPADDPQRLAPLRRHTPCQDAAPAPPPRPVRCSTAAGRAGNSHHRGLSRQLSRPAGPRRSTRC